MKMAKTIGSGNLTFGGLTGKFIAEGGFEIDGKSVPEVECTADDSATEEWGVGNVPGYGQMRGQYRILATSIDELDSLIGTSATLTYTFEIESSGNTTNATLAGTAYFIECPISAPKNGLVEGAAVFRWETKPTYSNEAA